MLFARCAPHFACRVSVHSGDNESNNQIRPSRKRVRRNESRDDDGDVRQNIISRGQKRRTSQTAAVRPKPRKQERACQVDHQGAETGE